MDRKWLSVIFALLTGSSCMAQLQQCPPGVDGIQLIYSPENGDFRVESHVGAITTFEMKSVTGQFTAVDNPLFGGLFDVNTHDKVFKLDPAGFESLILPGLLPPGLTFDAIATDLSIDGSLASGGTIPAVHLIPEPSGPILIVFGGLGMFWLRRRQGA